MTEQKTQNSNTYPIAEFPLRESFEQIDSIDSNKAPIAIDFGSYEVKAGIEPSKPLLKFPTMVAKVRDRVNSVTHSFVGNDLFLNSSFYKDAKSPFTDSFINNWEYTEIIMDYILSNLTTGNNESPILINEPLATISQQRSNWCELLFESYNSVNEVTFGIDSLYAYYGLAGNNAFKKNGIIINNGNASSNVIPILNGQADLSKSQRLDIGGDKLKTYLNRSLQLKYNTTFTDLQINDLFHKYSYAALDFKQESKDMLSNIDILEKKDITIQLDYKEPEVIIKSEEQLRLEHEKKQQLGLKLQEQAKIKREEKFKEKQEDYLYYTEKLENDWADLSKTELIRELEFAGFEDEQDFKKYMKSLVNSIEKAKNNDEDGDEEEEPVEPDTSLIDIPDADLTPDLLKQKRAQKLQLAGFKARQLNKLEKLKRKEELEQAIAKDTKWREQDLKSWLKDKHGKLKTLLEARKDKIQLKKELKDRKSAINQQKMKNLTSLVDEDTKDANEGGGRGANKRNRLAVTIDNDPNDTFGANDKDWEIYNKQNEILDDPVKIDEMLVAEFKEIVRLEQLLLEYDPEFSEEHTLNHQLDNSWRKSIMHRFLRGPNKYNDTLREHNQIHLNIERIKPIETLFNPYMQGLPQIGITDICRNIILGKKARLGNVETEICENIYLTGGVSNTKNLKQRVVKEFESWLPTDTNVDVHMSETPSLDCYNGMLAFSKSNYYKDSILSKKEYLEKGPEYLKEHKLSNVLDF